MHAAADRTGPVWTGSASVASPCRCGLIVNPIAGMGGVVGLKGTDGADVLAEAIARGATPQSETRTVHALRRLQNAFPRVAFVTGAGSLGERAIEAAGLVARIIGPRSNNSGDRTNASDTRTLAAGLEKKAVDLILVAGGDGTARDVFDATGGRVPLLGIPAGVKMHSAMFALSPGIAGDVAAQFFSQGRKAELRDAEIMDIDEASVRADRVSTRLFGYCRTPFERVRIQSAKAGSALSDQESMVAAAQEIASEMTDGALYLLGPGSSTLMIAETLGLRSTLLGVDAILDRTIVGTDLAESDILDLIADRPAKLIVGIIGGQGCLFGRGNQQVSARVLRQIDRDDIIVLAGASKLAHLAPPRLFVDTGDADLDAEFAGFIKVRTGAGQIAMVRIDA